jgi:RsiW-degrading membrane proteinase PrsW (M82 family)
MEAILFVQAGLAVWLYRYFCNHERGAKEPVKELQRACLFGLGAAVLAGAINNLFVPQSLLEYAETLTPSFGEAFRGSLFVSFNEEILKFLPLAIYLYKKPFFDELTDGVIYFGLAGMWFGVLENIAYTLQYGISTGVLRIVITPFLHAGFTAIAGVGLVRYKFITRNELTIISWLLFAIALHAVYDFSIFSGASLGWVVALVLAIVINLSVFFLLGRMQQADELAGRSASGINTFCRSCGKHNNEHYLYCVFCGKKA